MVVYPGWYRGDIPGRGVYPPGYPGGIVGRCIPTMIPGLYTTVIHPWEAMLGIHSVIHPWEAMLGMYTLLYTTRVYAGYVHPVIHHPGTMGGGNSAQRASVLPKERERTSAQRASVLPKERERNLCAERSPFSLSYSRGISQVDIPGYSWLFPAIPTFGHLSHGPENSFKPRPTAPVTPCFCSKPPFSPPCALGYSCQKGRIQAARIMGL